MHNRYMGSFRSFKETRRAGLKHSEDMSLAYYYLLKDGA
jgi:hypothetical protein